MIAEWFIGIGVGLSAWFLGMLPDTDWDDGMVVTGANALSSLMLAGGQISNWFPLDILALALSVTITAYVLLLLVRIVRWLWGLTPFSGGS